jgi:hypothetical protein
MRPPVGGDAGSAAYQAPRSRKSSLTDNHMPNTISGPPTTFFMATEEQLMGTSAQGGISDRRPSISEARRTSTGGGRQAGVNKSPDGHSGDRRSSVSEGRIGSTSKPTDSVYGVQSLEEALGGAFGDKSKEEQRPESSSGGFAALLGLKRKKTITSTDGNDKNSASDDARDKSPESSKNPSPRDTHLHEYHTRQSSRAPTVSQPLTPLQLESPAPNSALPSTPKSGSFRSLHLSDEDEGTEDGTSQAIASSGEEEEYDQNHNHGKTDMSGSVMPELVMPSLSMPVRRPFTAKGKQMGRLKVCVAGPAGKSAVVLFHAKRLTY